MAKTKGAIDRIKKRKTRRDKKRKYVRRGGKMIPYIPKRNKFDPIKIWFWQIRKMSPEGYQRFSRDSKLYMRKIVYKPTLRVDVLPDEITTKEDVEAFALKWLWEGNWLMMGFSHGKNKYRVKPVKLATINISQHPDGLRARMVQNFRLYRYFFWRK